MRELLSVTEAALWQGLAKAVVGGRLSDIGHAVETHVRAAGDFGIVEEYVGHGIGTSHAHGAERAQLRSAGARPEAGRGDGAGGRADGQPGGRHTRMLDDEWTVVTVDGKWSAHFEHTVAITAGVRGC